MELTEKFLISMCGWPVFKQAQAIHAAGRVVEAGYDPPVLKGRLAEGGKEFLCGLKFNNRIDVENLCPCRDSRVRGIICAHSVAVGLQVLKPVAARVAVGEKPAAPPRTAAASTAEKPRVVIALEGSLRHLEAGIDFRYDTPGAANPTAEAAVLAEIMESGFRDFRGKAALQGEEAVLKFFAATLPQWRAKWDVAEGARFQHVTRDLVRIEPKFAIRESSDGWLDVHIHHAAGAEALLSHADLARLLQSGQPHLRLKSGKVAVADPALAADLEEVLRDCNPRQERGGYRVAPEFRGYLETSIASWKGESLSESKLSPKHLGTLREKLRPYQIDGALWLMERALAGRGGLIADEMGLGKTVQALALIEKLEGGPALVVCPSSLVWNWRREAEQFLPGLSVLTIDGPDRDARLAQIPGHQLVVTSYALLRRDIERYRGVKFAAVFLDEAQHIKNPDSQNAKAACALEARSRFILTGTPIENSVRDLWSLFEFLLPGYLGSRADFRDRYETPLLEGGDGGALWARLSRRIGPYLLRRRKADVLADLPDKIEQVLEVELTEVQRATYARLQEVARSQVDQLNDKGQAGAARMRVLTALLRLRQACCDLRLLGATGNPSNDSEDAVVSAKLSALRELLGESIDGGHRVLVFSQFTSMLDLIERALGEDGVAFCRLDGSTKNRGEVVDRFQNDASIPVFLISLKAGGVGLNLTAADTVIHFDPWWNPAVEAQATDRAHRIGQKRVVTSIKLIARGTIEERVLALQRRKRELLAGTVDADAALAGLDDGDLRELVG